MPGWGDDPWGDAPWGTSEPPEVQPLALEHEFSRTGQTTVTLPDAAGERVGNFVPNNDIAGGYIDATAEITSEMKAAHPGLFKMGTTWKVKDPNNGKYVFCGELWDPAESGGRVALTAEGWGKRADKEVSRFLLQTRSMDEWTPGDEEPFSYGPTHDRLGMEILQRGIRFWIRRNTNFRSPNSPATPPWETTAVAWFPGTNVRFLGFTLNKTKNDGNYRLQVLSGDGPGGALTVRQTFTLDAGTPDGNYTVAIPAGDDLVAIRFARTTEAKRARPRRFWLTNLRVGGIATSDAYQLDDFFGEFFSRLGTASTAIAASSQNVLPFDAQNATLGQIADELAVLESWYWRVWATDAGTKLGEAGPRDNATLWRAIEPHQVVNLLPQERWNKVYFPYNAGNGIIKYKTVTASPNPFPVGFDRVFKLDWEEPPHEDVATVFAQHVADYLAKPDVTGSGTFSEVVLDSSPGTPRRVTEMRPGDRIKLENYGDLIVTIGNMRPSASGATAEIEFASGDPLLDRWLAERQRLLNRGRGNAAATIGALDPEEPAVPTGFVQSFVEAQVRGGRRRFHGFYEWDLVTVDVNGNGTWVDRYQIRTRPCNAAGTPIPNSGGGGWVTKTVRASGDGQDTEDLPDEAMIRNLENPHKWFWQAQMRALDAFGQESDWTALTTHQKPSIAAMPSLTNITLDIDPHGVEFTWDYPDDPDNAELAHPAIHHVEVQFDNNTSFASPLKKDRSVRGQRKRFRFNKPLTGTNYHGRLRTHDVYGTTSPWLPDPPGRITSQVNSPTAPTGLLVLFDDVDRTRFTKWQATCRWNELTTWEDFIHHYTVEFQSSADGVSWTAEVRRVTIPGKRDDDPNTVAQVIFGRISGKRWYRFRVRAVDKRMRVGAWSAWTAGDRPNTSPPPVPASVVGAGVFNHIELDWNDPTEASDSDIVDERVVYYQVQISKNAAFTNIVKFYKMRLASQIRYRTELYLQRYWMRVRSVDNSDNKSAWVVVGPLRPQKVRGARVVDAGAVRQQQVAFSNVVGVPMLSGQTNQAKLTANADSAVAYVDGEGANGTLDGLITTGSVLTRIYTGLAFRASATNNYLFCAFIGGTGLIIGRNNGGTITTLATAASFTVQQEQTYDVQVVLNGTSIQVYVDGVLRVSTTSAVNQSETRHGLFTRRGSSTLDNGESRWSQVTFTPSGQTVPSYDDDFDRSAGALGVAASGQSYSSSGSWEVEEVDTPFALFGNSVIMPLFYVGDNASYNGIPISSVSAGKDKFGLSGNGTQGAIFVLDRPTYILGWASANMENESTVNSCNMRFFIEYTVDGVPNYGRQTNNHSNVNDSANNRQRLLFTQHALFVDASESAPKTLEVRWAYATDHNSAVTHTIRNQKMTLFMSYAPDRKSAFDPVSVPNWTRSGSVRRAYRGVEGSD